LNGILYIVKGEDERGYETRLKLFNQFEALRGRPLIAYVTSLRPNVFGMMEPDALSSIISRVQAVPKTDAEVDFLIVSDGGDGMMASRTVNILREKFKKFSVLVPYAAFSAATLLSLGADEIITRPFSDLGPWDPQFSETMPTKSGQQETSRFSAEDIRRYFDFITLICL
jgi:ClpP class serine protease